MRHNPPRAAAPGQPKRRNISGQGRRGRMHIQIILDASEAEAQTCGALGGVPLDLTSIVACQEGAKPWLQATGAAHDLLEHQAIPHGGCGTRHRCICRSDQVLRGSAWLGDGDR